MHPLLKGKPGEKMLMLGNEAIARGAIEAGLAFATAYPGTPLSEIALQFFQISQESDLYFEYSGNEKVALEVAAGAARSGLRVMCTMKHVGVNVAADALMTLAYTGVVGSLVIVSADDPYMFSSQNEQDNRFYGKLSGLPVLEPSSVAEAKEMVKYAFDLSEKLGEPVIFRTTTRINHSSGVVELGPVKRRITGGDFKKNPVPPYTVALGKAQYPPVPETMSKIRGRVKKLIYFDATALALQAGSALALNMVMLGALAGSGVLPLETISIRETIRDKSKKSFVEINLMAFDLGMKALAAS